MEADGDWENYVKSQGANIEGDYGAIVQYTMFLLSCIFFNKYFYDTFWTDLIYVVYVHTCKFLEETDEKGTHMARMKMFLVRGHICDRALKRLENVN